MSNFSAISMQVIAEIPWMWATGEMKTVVNLVKNALDEAVKQNEFTRSFAVQDISVMKKKFEHTAISLVAIKNKTEELQDELDRVTRMTNAR